MGTNYITWTSAYQYKPLPAVYRPDEPKAQVSQISALNPSKGRAPPHCGRRAGQCQIFMVTRGAWPMRLPECLMSHASTGQAPQLTERNLPPPARLCRGDQSEAGPRAYRADCQSKGGALNTEVWGALDWGGRTLRANPALPAHTTVWEALDTGKADEQRCLQMGGGGELGRV